MVAAEVRVQKFAMRESLPLTAENRPLLLGYLSTTRRWRAGGLIAAIIASTAWSAAVGRGLSLQFLALFGGWFLGAVVAEWRVGVAARATDGKRSASLLPRRTSDYLTWPIIGFTALVSAAVLGLECAAIVTAPHDRWELVGLTALSVAVAAAIGAVGRHVLSRAQPIDEPSVVQADDVLRAHSLRVLVGSGIALAGYALSLTVAIAVRSSDEWGNGALSFGTAVGILMLPVLGLIVALAPSVHRRRGVASAAA